MRAGAGFAPPAPPPPDKGEPPPGAARSLTELAARARYDLSCLAYPNAPWLPRAVDSRGRPILDVVIAGAGQSGLSLWLALKRACVDNVLVVDRSAKGREGPWASYARMPDLRTPKYLTGPDAGAPSLTFRAWFEAQFGAEAWRRLDRIPRQQWMDYLNWLRAAIGVDVENGMEVSDVAPTPEGHLVIALAGAAGTRAVVARKLVLATGIEGGGAWIPPAGLTENLPRARWAHTGEAIDFAALRGRRVALLGAGSSAFDNALCAMDAGAEAVDLFCRGDSISQPHGENVRGWLENVGFLSSFSDLPDADKWRLMRRMIGKGAPPPSWTFDAARADSRLRLFLSTQWLSTAMRGETVSIRTNKGDYSADFLIFGTGPVTDLALRPELRRAAPLAAVWADRYAPPPEESCGPLLRFPYLGEGMQLTERAPGTAKWIGDIHLFHFGATLSLGLVAASITGMKFGLERLTRALVRDLYLKTADAHLAAFPW